MATTKVKSGFLRYYDRSFLDCFSSWKQTYAVLFGDSALVWYKDQGSEKPIGSVKLSRVCKFLAVGQTTLAVPKRPDHPKGSSVNHMMAVPSVPSKDPDKIKWFAFADNQDLVSWMNAIASTLPRPSQNQQQAPPPPGPNERPPPYNPSAPQAAGNQQGGYPGRQGNLQGQGGANTTVIVDQRGGYGGGYYDGGAAAVTGLATGMMLGSLLTVPYWGYGWGWGFGGPVLDLGPDVVINENVTIVDENVFIQNDNSFYDGGTSDFGSAWGADGGYGGFDGGYQGDYDQGYDGGYDGGDFGGGDYGGGDFGGGDFGGGDFGGGDYGGDFGGGDF